MYVWIPVESASISAIPMIPILPAKDVSNVLVFFVIRLLSESESAVKKDIEGFLFFFFSSLKACFLSFSLSCARPASRAAIIAASSSVASYGCESLITSPSESLIIREAYSSASSGL